MCKLQPLNPIYVLRSLSAILQTPHLYDEPISAGIYFQSDCMWQWYYRADAWRWGRGKLFVFIYLQEVILQQANNTDNIYYCIQKVRVIFTVTVDQTSAAAPAFVFVSLSERPLVEKGRKCTAGSRCWRTFGCKTRGKCRYIHITATEFPFTTFHIQ